MTCYLLTLFLAQFSGLMSTSYSTKKKNVKLLQQLTEYMRYKELPRHIQQRILTYFYFWSNKSVKKDKIITSNLSPNLREVFFFIISKF